jgi:hypothetical protein
MKKHWRTPELVILFKGRPEEGLLCHCKHMTAPPVAPYNHKNNCTSNPLCCQACSDTRSHFALGLAGSQPGCAGSGLNRLISS